MIHAYHDGTKHHFDRFARSTGYLDWSSQPAPFRTFSGAPLHEWSPDPDVRPVFSPPPTAYDSLFLTSSDTVDLQAAAIGDLFRHALGLSAWKQFRDSRWALRVNPSSGNLHPTEAYLVTGPETGLAESAGVFHYASDRHALEQRARVEPAAWAAAWGDPSGACLIALTSIHWREAWKYGERAFRYCQHDLGHAIAAVRFAAALMGWSARILPDWPQRDIASLVGIDRDEDFVEAEREEPACVLLIRAATDPRVGADRPLSADPSAPGDLSQEQRARFVSAVRGGRWFGRANQLSERHVEWTFIDQVARATEDPGRVAPPEDISRPKGLRHNSLSDADNSSAVTQAFRPADSSSAVAQAADSSSAVAEACKPVPGPTGDSPTAVAQGFRPAPGATGDSPAVAQAFRPADANRPDARSIILKRRSALAFDGRSSIGRSAFTLMLARAMPGPHAPWDALWWTPRIHLALFVHRVDDVDPGLYMLARDPLALERLKTACTRDFLWEAADDRLPLWCLARGDCRRLARRLSCDQEIAADGFFSLGMIAEFDASLVEHGPSFYRHLFWESGVVGQVLYLEAEAAGARATGIGCFYDDPVHDALGLTDHAFQSLYHFTVGMPVDDSRLTTQPGYDWEVR